MSYSRTIAALILSAFMLALGVGSLHVHAAHFDTNHVLSASVDHDADASCSFCSVIKTKTAAITSQSDITFLVVAHHHAPIHAEQQACTYKVEQGNGRAPPTICE